MLPKSRILLFQVLIPYLNFFFLFYYFTTVVIQLQYKLRPVEYRMFEVLVERDSIVRTSIDTKLTEHTSTQVIFISCQDFLLLAVLCLDVFSDNLDGVIRTGHLTQTAGYTAMFVILIMGHVQCAAEPVEHFQLFPVFGILLGYFLTKIHLDTGLHTRCQCTDAVHQTT